jgi:hypothetical protein
MARTAVVAGTATAVAGGVHNRQASKANEAAQADAAQQAALQSQAELAELKAQQAAAAPAPGGADLTTELTRLAELHGSGVLSDEEFSAAKQKLLG